jgi:hypothetical protein
MTEISDPHAIGASQHIKELGAAIAAAEAEIAAGEGIMSREP